MNDFDDLPDSLLDLYAEECAEGLRELGARIASGETPKGAVRVFIRNGETQDFVWGYESEEEKAALLALLEKHEQGKSEH